MNIEKLEHLIHEQYIPLKEHSEFRFHDVGGSSNRDRNEFQRDYARILYSTSFRRLQGKMQLLDIKEDKFYRNRLTHSLEVAQIARSIAELLNKEIQNHEIYKDDIYVIESGALAHDIGNPPFGHYGERILNTLMKDFGGFEGNAQTIRVLMELEKKYPNVTGLDLIWRTLFSTVKYFKPYEEDTKKFLYKDNYNFLLSKIDN